MKAAPADQQRLLELQGFDSRMAQLRHERANLPQIAELEMAEAEYARRDALRIAAETTRADLARDLAKAEADVELVRDRIARDNTRLEQAGVSARDVQALVTELASLKRRQASLEDIELETLERKDSADRKAAETDEAMGKMNDHIEQLRATIESATAQINAAGRQIMAERKALAATLPGDLLDLYERIRARSSGLGAAKLTGSTCGGCRLSLNPADLSVINALSPHDIARCEECGRILVR